ncbi:MAG: acylneuraminate cytidylyltransferase family protein [Oscillospiraceae bacterium]|nr:acylneuraminate cytidylyltransferase family protein [Oscillospiraceae bacterium]
MYKNKKILAIIPARSNSKGVKDKNIKLLRKKPLICYTISEAIKSKIFDFIFVSTNSKRYAEISQKCGAKVPFLRPEEISTDTSGADEYIINSIETLKTYEENFDYFVVLQPTSPFRTSDDIKNAVKLIINENLSSVISVCKGQHCLENYGKLSKSLSMYKFSTMFNRQDVAETYRINGAIYVSKCEIFLKEKTFYLKNSKAYIMDAERSVDIDTQFDFSFAEFLLKNNLNHT